MGDVLGGQEGRGCRSAFLEVPGGPESERE